MRCEFSPENCSTSMSAIVGTTEFAFCRFRNFCRNLKCISMRSRKRGNMRSRFGCPKRKCRLKPSTKILSIANNTRQWCFSVKTNSYMCSCLFTSRSQLSTKREATCLPMAVLHESGSSFPKPSSGSNPSKSPTVNWWASSPKSNSSQPLRNKWSI